MTNPTQDATTEAFRGKVTDFHASLPAEEQALLEQVFALAQVGADIEVSGFARSDLVTPLSTAFVSKADWDRSGVDAFNGEKGYGF